jgi:TatD DNase family protein
LNFELVDTHCHVYGKQFDSDRDAMMQRASEVGVNKLFLPNVDLESIPRMHDLYVKYSERCYPMMGLHPCSVEDNYMKDLAWVEQYLFNQNPELNFGKFYAVGEIGLDYYWDKTFIPQQKDAFRKQIQWAKQLQLSIAVHARDSIDDILEIIEEQQDGTLTGVLHCFTGNIEQAQIGIALNFYLGIGGVVTFKNSGLDIVVEQLELKHLVLETDAPYLAPVPHRGKRNESSYTLLVAEKIASLKNISVEEVASATTANALRLFKIKS